MDKALDEMKNRISLALKDPILQQGFEIICKNLSELEKENAELKELCILRKMRIEDLEEQIKKMKCCGNCGKWENCEKDEMFSYDICGDWELER